MTALLPVHWPAGWPDRTDSLAHTGQFKDRESASWPLELPSGKISSQLVSDGRAGRYGLPQDVLRSSRTDHTIGGREDTALDAGRSASER